MQCSKTDGASTLGTAKQSNDGARGKEAAEAEKGLSGDSALLIVCTRGAKDASQVWQRHHEVVVTPKVMWMWEKKKVRPVGKL